MQFIGFYELRIPDYEIELQLKSRIFLTKLENLTFIQARPKKKFISHFCSKIKIRIFNFSRIPVLSPESMKANIINKHMLFESLTIFMSFQGNFRIPNHWIQISFLFPVRAFLTMISDVARGEI